MRPDKVMAQHGDLGNAVDVAFSQGAGEDRVRWGCRLTPQLALDLSRQLKKLADAAACNQLSAWMADQ